ncbi:thiamin pyrophosphokinase 1 [Basidiobolus meristosporus CBS 931.73]|uniref:Thiamine pyrophosphokinase n=1 Tax=Basidiobolus meristosporus CBS 931.73 TaxID=1314790 RepID=A0A1Y1ZDD7_9FUNG|nr:thiamin pyrophosphokinase 1 [Basidiobolus meristosporus CBS 931.73]|eukprot:ORY08261.1 thiamin pyrophosphokinase 1 [Basidiobolus meristosporus CBS 931.73]
MTETITHKSPLCNELPPFAVVVLNQPIPHKNTIFKHIWKRASIRLCADGGTNRLHDAFSGTEDLEKYIPDYVVGDFDSIRPEVKEFYEKKGVTIKKVEDQYSTDFTKCVNIVRERELERPNETPYDIVGMGAIGGRFDQTMSSIQMLHMLKDERKVYLISDDSSTFLLDKGKHEIICNREIEGPTCGLLPIGFEKTVLTTEGLRWNLDQTVTEFGGLVSTSNIIDSHIIKVETNKPVVWTIELKSTDSE